MCHTDQYRAKQKVGATMVLRFLYPKWTWFSTDPVTIHVQRFIKCIRVQTNLHVSPFHLHTGSCSVIHVNLPTVVLQPIYDQHSTFAPAATCLPTKQINRKKMFL